MRNLLARLGDHSFTEGDWKLVRDESFDGRCAYCGKLGSRDHPLERDHIVPINVDKLGEHHLGNLVPACSACNNRKKSLDYADFLSGEPGRKKVIECHMQQRGYVPLRGDGPERVLLEAARAELGGLAERYASLLNDLRAYVGASEFTR